MAAGLMRVRRARRVGGMAYQYAAWTIRSRWRLRRDNRATRRPFHPINVGADVAPVEGTIAEPAQAGPEVPLERVDESDLGHARRTGRLARIVGAVAADDDVAAEDRARRESLQRPGAGRGIAALHAVRTALEQVAVHHEPPHRGSVENYAGRGDVLIDDRVVCDDGVRQTAQELKRYALALVGADGDSFGEVVRDEESRGGNVLVLIASGPRQVEHAPGVSDVVVADLDVRRNEILDPRIAAAEHHDLVSRREVVVLDLEWAGAVVAEHRLRVAVVAVALGEPRVDDGRHRAVERDAALEIERRRAVDVAAVEHEVVWHRGDGALHV